MENKNYFFKKVKVSSLLGKIIPNIENQKHKGDNGVVGVIGGSFEYTGAPYYSAISALKSGSDLAHVFCHVDSAIPIKSYSPELIVHPGFDHNKDNINLLKKTAKWFKSMDSLVVGPGLGREDSTFYNFNFFLQDSLKLKSLIHIIDADGLWHLMNSEFSKLPIEEDSLIILTPNKAEFNRLYNKFVDEDDEKSGKEEEFNIGKEEDFKDSILYIEDLQSNVLGSKFKKEIELASELKNRVIIKKGKYDFITDGKRAFIVGNLGSLKRCGGLGDILNGVVATFCGMLSKQAKKQDVKISNDELLEASALACFLCKVAARKGYEKHGYALTAPDVIVEFATLAKNYNF